MGADGEAGPCDEVLEQEAGDETSLANLEAQLYGTAAGPAGGDGEDEAAEADLPKQKVCMMQRR
jgi:hypothetical protein